MFISINKLSNNLFLKNPKMAHKEFTITKISAKIYSRLFLFQNVL